MIMLPDGSNRTPVGGVLQTTWDPATQHAAIVLEGAEHDAGDNYQIEASFDPAFSCESDLSKPCATSAIITTRKRIYVETHQMFRAGSFLAADVAAGATEIPVTNHAVFRDGDQVTFMHGVPIGTPAGTPRTMWEESATIALPTPSDKRPGVYRDARRRWVIRLTSGLAHDYSAGIPGASVTADGIGIDASGFFRPDTSMLHDFYQDSFVDAVDVVPTMAKVPFFDFSIPGLRPVFKFLFAARYFENKAVANAAPTVSSSMSSRNVSTKHQSHSSAAVMMSQPPAERLLAGGPVRKRGEVSARLTTQRNDTTFSTAEGKMPLFNSDKFSGSWDYTH